MSFSHGKDSLVFVHGKNVTGYFRSFSVPTDIDTAEVSAFGDSDKKYIVGMNDGTMGGDGIFDGAASAIDEKLSGLVGASDKVVSYFPAGDAKGATGKAALADETSYEASSDLGDAVAFTFEAQATLSGIERVVSVLSKATSVAATGDQAIQNDGAASTLGGSAFLHALSKVGGTVADVTLRHSTDNFVANDTLLATFTQVSAAGVAERVAIAGTIKQYVRAAVTLGSGGTWTFSVALHRNV
jgi:hypothetical protein